MKKHHDVLLAHAKGTRVPSIDDVSADRDALQTGPKDVVDYGHRIIAHRTPPGAPETAQGRILKDFAEAV